LYLNSINKKRRMFNSHLINLINGNATQTTIYKQYANKPTTEKSRAKNCILNENFKSIAVIKRKLRIY